MNQAIKRSVYQRGNQAQVEFVARLGGMTEEEQRLFKMLHDGLTDLEIQEELALSQKAYNYVEQSVRAKLLLAVFDCINYTMDNK